MTTYFTSDTHFFHRNVIGFCDRPYKDVEEMNQVLINNWNEVVKPIDTIWFLGDFSFGKVLETEQVLLQLNGFKHLIMGNHDRKGRSSKLKWERYFISIHDYFRLKVDGYKFVLCHFPFTSWERNYVNLHGHSHNTLSRIKGRWDVGVDANNYYPISATDAQNLAYANTTLAEYK